MDIFFLKMQAPKKTSFRAVGGNTATNCLEGSYVSQFCTLELVQDGIRPCHLVLNRAFSSDSINTESETIRNSLQVKCTWGRDPVTRVSVVGAVSFLKAQTHKDTPVI
jgi:hypothetical protein